MRSRRGYRRFFGSAAGALLLLFIGRAEAQNIVLKSGQTIATTEVRRTGDTIMAKVQVGTSTGEVGYPVNTIAKLDFPEPPQLKTAADLLAQSQPEKALVEINPIIAFYDPLKDVPGSWWSSAALIKVSALVALKRDAESEALASQILKTSTDPEAVRAAQLRIAAGLVRKQDFDKAGDIVDAVIKESTRPEVLAEAWADKGQVLLAKKETTPALIAFLHVPVFYPDQKTFMPPALLGSARAYRDIEDVARAERSYNDLMTEFPSSPEAAVAKVELIKLEK